MNESEANEMKEQIFAQLDEFDEYVAFRFSFDCLLVTNIYQSSFSSPPFTIQRLCELCIKPKQHYTSVGKYLRAVDKSILVTSTWSSFPPLTQSEIQSYGRGATLLGSTLQSAPSTPLFSPIPFLHDDARRSKSRSPPTTPLSLNPLVDEPLEMKALGLVDELDDPSPGHMSDQPTAISSVTAMEGSPHPRPFMTLEQRFVKAEDAMDTTSNGEVESDRMDMDEDKENAKS
jgi:serine/threonine-protein phosphatase 4 regulatory subunit 2